MRGRCSLGFLLGLALVLTSLNAKAQDIFVTPIADAPFAGTVSVERTIVQANGGTLNLKTMYEIGRDGQGRIHNESRVLEPVSSTATPQVVRIHLYDPKTRISTMIDPQQKTFWTQTLNRPPSTEPPTLADASPTSAYRQQNQFAKQEDLGTAEIAGLQVHGVRTTQTIPASASGAGKDVVVTDEYWYSSDLRINLAIKHVDPRTGSVTIAVTQMKRTEPDAEFFAVPQGYTLRERSSMRPASGQPPIP